MAPSHPSTMLQERMHLPSKTITRHKTLGKVHQPFSTDLSSSQRRKEKNLLPPFTFLLATWARGGKKVRCSTMVPLFEWNGRIWFSFFLFCMCLLRTTKRSQRAIRQRRWWWWWRVKQEAHGHSPRHTNKPALRVGGLQASSRRNERLEPQAPKARPNVDPPAR